MVGFCTCSTFSSVKAWAYLAISLIKLSDRYGRVRIMSFAVFGLLATDVNFLATVNYHKYLPGGYWFILVGPLLDGAFGGEFD